MYIPNNTAMYNVITKIYVCKWKVGLPKPVGGAYTFINFIIVLFLRY